MQRAALIHLLSAANPETTVSRSYILTIKVTPIHYLVLFPFVVQVIKLCIFIKLNLTATGFARQHGVLPQHPLTSWSFKELPLQYNADL